MRLICGRIEKQALEGVIERICRQYRVAYFSCKGYVSQSEMFDAGHYRLTKYVAGGQIPIILHFGDHDPSGIDMTRDIKERIKMFMMEYEHDFEIRRLALNMDQIQKYNPPPNPAKVTDSRFESYNRIHGDESWELDALDPKVLVNLVRTEVEGLIAKEQWKAMKEKEGREKEILNDISANFSGVVEYLGDR
jgi:hypothetical protein